MSLEQVALPHISEEKSASVESHEKKMVPNVPAAKERHRRKTSTFVQAPLYLTGADQDYLIEEDAIEDDEKDQDDDDVFFEAPDLRSVSPKFWSLL